MAGGPSPTEDKKKRGGRQAGSCITDTASALARTRGGGSPHNRGDQGRATFQQKGQGQPAPIDVTLDWLLANQQHEGGN